MLVLLAPGDYLMLDLPQAATNFLPHGYCLLWRPGLLWTLVGSDLLIALSYFTIPIAILQFARRQPKLHFPAILVLFGAFILACGMTHVLEVVNIWRPMYEISAGTKAFTAIVSVITAIAVWPMLRDVSKFIDERSRLQDELASKNEQLASALSVSEQNKRALERSEKAFRSTLMNAPIGMAMVSVEGTFLMVNKALCEMLGYAASELEKMTFQQITHADDLDADLLHVASLIDGLTSTYRMEKRYLHKNGHVVFVQLDVVLNRDATGQPSHFISQIQDITARKQMERALLDSRHRYRTLLDNLPTAVVVHRADTTIEYANPAASTMLALTQDQLLGKSAMDPYWKFVCNDGSDMPLDDFPVMQVASRKAPLHNHLTGVIRGKDESPAWMLVNAFPLMTSEGELDRIIVSFIDISSQKKLEQDLARQARTDHLTGLNNRRQFDEEANKELARHSRNGMPLALLAVDLDHFKRINDDYGHDVGDAVLCQFADICKREIRENDIACRLGGEEFAVLMPEAGLEEAKIVAERLRNAISDACIPIPGTSPLLFTSSIGVAVLTDSDRSIEQIIKRADKALYTAKENGRNRVECVHA